MQNVTLLITVVWKECWSLSYYQNWITKEGDLKTTKDEILGEEMGKVSTNDIQCWQVAKMASEQNVSIFMA